MGEPETTPFHSLLQNGLDRGGFQTDDVLSLMLPLMEQVLAIHELALVAPLNGLQHLEATDEGQLRFAAEKATPSSNQLSQVEKLQKSACRAMEIVAEVRHTADVTDEVLTLESLHVSNGESDISRPVFLPGYKSWEAALGHHDVLTDIFLLGQLLASFACGLDLSDMDDLIQFARDRNNLFSVNAQINAVVASVIVQMTELNRHQRAQDLNQLISRLANYREQPPDLNFNRIGGYEEAGLGGKRRLMQSRLRDRLFEMSRRNRLIHFKSTLQTLNLTVASVPLLLDYRNIKREQLFFWHPELAAILAEGAPMSLGKYLRFEDAPYISGILDKIISEARRDRAEYGFAQLRLVLCFLRWNNLKESPEERIHSPLLLLPVELTRKKGVRDNYVLDPTTSEAEVNPALRHFLKDIYNLDLPEMIDLKETRLDDFYESLKAQIQASEPGVTLNKIDLPQIELIHEKARQRLDQYSRKIKLRARRVQRTVKPEYNYDARHFHPLGLQLFFEKVRPVPLPLRGATDASPGVRRPGIVEPEAHANEGKVLETESKRFALKEGENQNPYSWDFDLCNLTLGNFNYRKMTLVRDYTNLIETDLASTAFDTVFSLTPKPPSEETAIRIPLADQHLVISCDATQASAIARARTGGSYIIQGPPGTGKSQTITNLIADYVARGKRVLFVCEKRAAIDVVYHRLRQQGLDELCCLIHDSQTDKKAFIQNLKQTYETFLERSKPEDSASRSRNATVRSMDTELEHLDHFSRTMSETQAHIGIPVHSLLHRLVELGESETTLTPQMEEIIPEYCLWIEHGPVIERLAAIMKEMRQDLCFARHPLCWLGRGIIEADRSVEALAHHLDQAEDLLDSVENALALSGLPKDSWDTFEEIQAILAFAEKAKPLAERGLLGILVDAPGVKEFDTFNNELDAKTQAVNLAREKTSAWHEPLSPGDVETALAQTPAFENSILRYFQPAYWRLKKTLEARYNFKQHAVEPKWSKVLRDLAARQEAERELAALQDKARTHWQIDEVAAFRRTADEMKAAYRTAEPSVQALVTRMASAPEAAQVFEELCRIKASFQQLDEILRNLLAEHIKFDLPRLTQLLEQLRGQSQVLAELQPILTEFLELPESLGYALRRVEIPLTQFESAMALKSLNSIYRTDRSVNRFNGRILARRMENLEKNYKQWLTLNSRCIRSAVTEKFLEHASLSALPASQLDSDQKTFKKTYAAGRRDLEHEFGKTMRYKSIRDLAAGETGRVIQDLKPIWLMSPLSVSDTLPLDPNLFDVVIFDEASQIPLEEAIPAIYRAHQAIVVGDEMQLPPTTFFAGTRAEEESVFIEEEGERIKIDLDSDSFLSQSAVNLPSVMLAWHYRSRYESLISFSNAAFYGGNLFTIPDRQRSLPGQVELIVTATEQAEANAEAVLARSLSYHFVENGVYEERRNASEAEYIARLVRSLLLKETKLSIGVVAFSEAQQTEIEAGLHKLAEEDDAFASRVEAEFIREENDIFCGLFVKNLENVQGDERDIIIMSVCYAPGPDGRMLMNFGPINQRGGEKRLNVIFSRAKHHMAVVSSIRHDDITNDYNDGANSLKNFLEYAEAVSRGDENQARRVLENLNPISRKSLAPASQANAVVEALAEALRKRGHLVDLNAGQSRFRCDLAIRRPSDQLHQLGILIDTDTHYENENLLDRYLLQPGILKAFGWRCAIVLTKDWYHSPDDVVARIEKLLRGEEIVETEVETEPAPPVQSREESAQKTARTGTASSSPRSTPPKVTPHLIRYFELTSAASKKFWEISFNAKTFTVRFGRIGAPGQTQTKTFADEAKAKIEMEKLIVEKIAKGYEEIKT